MNPTPLVAALLLSLAACSPADGASSPPATPDSATLCQLGFGRSHVSDAVALLGPPEATETFADGSGFLAYQYATSPQVVLLELDFTAAQVLSDAITLNLTRPTCWSLEGGAGDVADAVDAAPDGAPGDGQGDAALDAWSAPEAFADASPLADALLPAADAGR